MQGISDPGTAAAGLSSRRLARLFQSSAGYFRTACCVLALLSPAGIAPASAADFSARGNEPGWHVEVDDTSLVFRTMNGEVVTISPVPSEVQSADGARTFRSEAEGRPFVLTIADEICVDTMSGMPHPLSARLSWGTEQYSGCGGDPAALLQGEWVIEEIGGRAVLPQSTPTIAFGDDNRATGHGSCNRFMGNYTLTGEGLTLSSLASTQMMCDGPLMDQEHAIMQALEKASGFDVDSGKRLRLLGGDTPLLVMRKE